MHGMAFLPDSRQAQPSSQTVPLSERDTEILAFERQWWKYAGAKEQAVREKFQMSATRYYQVLNALIDKPEALAVDPLLVKRLRRLRETRQRVRSARRLGIDLTNGLTGSPSFAWRLVPAHRLQRGTPAGCASRSWVCLASCVSAQFRSPFDKLRERIGDLFLARGTCSPFDKLSERCCAERSTTSCSRKLRRVV